MMVNKKPSVMLYEVCNDLLSISDIMGQAWAVSMAMHEIFFERLYDDEINEEHRKKRHEYMVYLYSALMGALHDLKGEIESAEGKYEALHEHGGQEVEA